MPNRFRRDTAKVAQYCARHQSHYDKYCNSKMTELDRDAFAKLAKFCPAFEKHCSTGKAGSVPTETESGTPLSFDLVMPPPLPKGSDFAQVQ